MLTVDSYAWIELLRGGPRANQVESVMREAEGMLVPAISLPEVAIRLNREGWPAADISHALRWIVESAEVIPIDIALSLEAARCTQELRENASKLRLSPPGLADGLVLATARRTGSRVLSGDSHFHGLTSTVWIGSNEF